jgi:TIM-barrel protein
MLDLGRREWTPEDPVTELRRQAALLADTDVLVGLNLRAATPEAYARCAEEIGSDVVYEIDAHCRQEPMLRAEAGEYLVTHPDKLALIIHALKETGATVSVKYRAGVNGDDALFARRCTEAGADILHVDLMDYGHAKCRQIRNATPRFLIANNGLYSFDRVMEMFSHGADMVSVARRSEEQILAGLDAAITRYADEIGWYNAPKQLCRGGDLRSLTFCCLPVKECALIPALRRAGLSREEYVAMKTEAAEGTPLAPGPYTCFGSLMWCCKITSPCMLRDTCMDKLGLSPREYMRQKHLLSRKIMKRVFHDLPADERSRTGAARDGT